MLRIIKFPDTIPNALPISELVHDDGYFEPGQIAQTYLSEDPLRLTVGVSNGRRAVGIIDDIRSPWFTEPVLLEKVIVPVLGNSSTPTGSRCSSQDIMVELKNCNIESESFISQIPVELIPRNGIIIFPAGTPINYSNNNLGYLCSEVSYRYKIPNRPSYDSTFISGRITLWNVDGMIFQTDQIDSKSKYKEGDFLFVDKDGRFTTTNYFGIAKSVGQVMECNAIASKIVFKWFKQ